MATGPDYAVKRRRSAAGDRPRGTQISRRALAGGFAAVAGVACVLTPVAANAHPQTPAKPSHVRVESVSSSSLTVHAQSTAHKYRLYAAHKRGHLATDKITSHALKSHVSHKPKLRLKGLKYTTKPYYYRIKAVNGSKKRYSDIAGPVGLAPATPTNLQVSSTDEGTSLTWNSGAVTGFTVTQATDAAMTQNVQTYTITGQDQQFTPPHLAAGTTYYFQVEAVNNSTVSAASNTVQAMSMSSAQPVKLMTYNILEATADGRSEGHNTVAPWSKRRTGVINFINKAAPDVVSIQEGGSWVAAVRGPRQVDDLVTGLGGTYSLADTEIPPSQPHYFRTGCYILYKTADYTAVEPGGHWGLGDSRWAAYQVLQNNASGAKFLVVAPHLMVTKNGGTDQMREDEAESMVSQATAYDTTVGNVPIVYAGDFNSDPSQAHSFNGPSNYLLSQSMDDSFDVSPKHKHAKFDSANGYYTKPPKHAERIDYIFAPPGVAVTGWKMLLNLKHGKFHGVIPSDHNPVVADLRIPYPSSS
jgi:endonuclease/exonuclease/phosphatase family metal-dependent hydrolase